MTATANAYSTPHAASVTSHASTYVMPAVWSAPAPISEEIPISIPRDEVYYWTARWQSDEAESVHELVAGEAVTFSSATDAIRWLLDPSDDS